MPVRPPRRSFSIVTGFPSAFNTQEVICTNISCLKVEIAQDLERKQRAKFDLVMAAASSLEVPEVKQEAGSEQSEVRLGLLKGYLGRKWVHAEFTLFLKVQSSQGGGGPQNVVAAFQADPLQPSSLSLVRTLPGKNGLAALNAKKKGSKGPLAGGFGSGFGGNSGGENLNDMPPPRPGTADPQGRLRHSGSGSFGTGGRHGNSGSGNGFTSSFGSHRAQREGTNAGPKIMAPIPMQAPSSLLSGRNTELEGAYSGFKAPALRGMGQNGAAGHRRIGPTGSERAAVYSKSFVFRFDPWLGHFWHLFCERSQSKTKSLLALIWLYLKTPQLGVGYDHFLAGMDTGPRRVIIDLDSENRGGQGAGHRQQDFGIPGHNINGEGRVFQQQGGSAPAGRQQTGRKRNRDSVEASGSPYEMPNAKRLKVAGDGRRGGSHEVEPDYPSHQEHGRRSVQPQRAGTSYQPPRPQSPQQRPLDKLFGVDFDENDDQGSRMCLTFAKGHMMKQIQFYTKLQTKLDNYSEVLEDRKEWLHEATEKVLVEGKSVLK
ncbi:hypothetical protein DFP72DRAFT_1168565 [Ephemerocybe angulata]|uniref:Uncharacterized protein n=1 Tax=Ephemerocybe angulata TaxID=980116 RepID=A0A8H6I0R6_9AGAR|nr:hypothetical protein DFP72DRAFT_1168565 [Tulosesus angulatus]